jgi:hypothetical protein
MVSAPLAAVLRNRREDFNARFERARHLFPQLDGEQVLDFASAAVDPVAVAVNAVDPTAVDAVVSAAYDAALTVVGQKLAGSAGRYPAITDGWQRVFPACAKHLVTAPDRVIAALSNALHSLASAGAGARPDEWIAAMTRLAPDCADVESLLQVGQVAAWRAGLAHFRDGALALAATLPPQLAAVAIGAPNRRAVTDVLARLSQDIWFDPAAAGEQSATLRLAREVGAFRGYGGLFKQPPQIAAVSGGWLVRSADDYWFLTADAFGATFHRATADEWNGANLDKRFPPDTRLTGQKLKQGSNSLTLPMSGPVTSATTSGNTLALTSSHTHTILFVALGGGA